MSNLTVDLASGLLAGVRYVSSPNADDRPPGIEPELLVVHAISLPPGELGGPWIEALFTNQLDPDAHPYFAEIHSLRVSAHVVIQCDGALTQYVPFHRRAWHAGVSRYRGRERCNDFSVGIELEGATDIAFADAQYETLTATLRALIAAYPRLSPERITGHADIAPGRKTDPGPNFDWARLRAGLERA